MNSMSNWIATAPFEPTVTGVASLDIIQRNASGQWVNKPVMGTEVALNTPVAGANDTVLGTANLYYATPFTIASTATFFIVTGFEVLNGTVVNGNYICGLEVVDANPPVLAFTNTVAWQAAVAQAGTSAVQRMSRVTSSLLPAGTLVAPFVSTSSASGRFGTTTVGSVNRLRAVAFTSDQPNGRSTAWAAGTEEPYIKVYGRPVL